MTLENFVSTVLEEIIKGTKSALEPVTAAGGEVNPKPFNIAKIEVGDPTRATHHDVIQPVEFDVAITTISETSGKASADVPVLAVGGSVSGSSLKGSISRIRFTVPVILPRKK